MPSAIESFRQMHNRRRRQLARTAKKRKPITTKQKIRKAEAVRKAKGGDDGPWMVDSEEAEESESDFEEQDNEVATEPPRVLDRLRERVTGRPVVKPVTTKMPREGVLVRATEQAQKWRREHPVPAAGVDEATQTFRLLALPPVVRTRIYTFAVVDHSRIIWPDSTTGREQPDLAMACREVRNEVLPIFYSQNIFGISIARPMQQQKKTGRPRKEPLSGLAAVEAWAETLTSKRNEGGKWFKMIKNFMLEYTDPEGSDTMRSRGSSRDASFVILLTLKQPSKKGREADSEREPGIDIHRNALCLIKAGRRPKCKMREVPECLTSLVTNMLENSSNDDGSIGSASLVEMVIDTRAEVDAIGQARCFHR